MSAFLHQGGYAAFVWPAYAISALGLIAATVLTLWAYRKARTRLAALQERKQ